MPTCRNEFITYHLVHLSRNPSYIDLSKSFAMLVTKAFMILGLTLGFVSARSCSAGWIECSYNDGATCVFECGNAGGGCACPPTGLVKSACIYNGRGKPRC